MSKEAVTAAWGWYSGSLEEPASLPAGVVQQYRDHGHVLLRGFFNPREMLELAPLLRETTEDHRLEYPRWAAKLIGKEDVEPDGAKQFVRVYGLLDKEPGLAALMHSPRLAKAAMDLEGMADGVRYYQGQAFFKEPGDHGSTFHADNYACPLDTSNQLTTAWLPFVGSTQPILSQLDFRSSRDISHRELVITETDRDMGVLAFARGSHLDMNMQFLNNGKAFAGNTLPEEEQLTGEHGVYAPAFVKDRFLVDLWPKLRPGDVTFHSGWTLHCSFPNTKPHDSGQVREAAAISYVPESVRTLPSDKFAAQFAADDSLNGVREKIEAAGIEPSSPVPEDILPRMWPR